MEPQAEKNTSWKDLKTRTVSSALLAALALILLWLGGAIFASFIILAAIILVREWEGLTERESRLFRFAGYAYVILPCACLVWMRGLTPQADPSLGFKVVFALIAVISATDTGAYFTGRKFGHYKLAPAISPNKTWEGLAGGIAAATVTGIIASSYIHLNQSFIMAIFISPAVAVIAQIGDLFKSWIKRRAGVKDSGNLIPGHGGLLDRLDGYMFTAPLLALILYFALKDSM